MVRTCSDGIPVNDLVTLPMWKTMSISSISYFNDSTIGTVQQSIKSVSSGLEKLRTCVLDVLEVKNLTYRVLYYFLASTFTNTLHFLSTWSNFKELGVHVFQNDLYVRLLKPATWHVFQFMFYVLSLTILNVLIVSKLVIMIWTPRWSVSRAFFFGILKIRGFVFVKIYLIVATIMPAYFAKLNFPRCFNSAFLLFKLTQT